MIRTGETIGDPGEWLTSYLDHMSLDVHRSVDTWNFPYSEVILAEDYDVLVSGMPHVELQKDVELLDNEQNATDGFFGSLYPAYSAKIHSNDHAATYDVYAYPSPSMVNAISEELGFRPGEDVPEFVHDDERTGLVQDDFIVPLVEYTERFLAQGQYPLAVSHSVLFRHDRKPGVHIDGARMQPKDLFQTIVHAAQTATNAEHKENLAIEWDSHTNFFSYDTKSVTRTKIPPQEIDADDIVDIVERLLLRGSGLNPEYWTRDQEMRLEYIKEKVKSSGYRDSHEQWVRDVVKAHLLDLNDRVRKLEARRAQEAA